MEELLKAIELSCQEWEEKYLALEDKTPYEKDYKKFKAWKDVCNNYFGNKTSLDSVKTEALKLAADFLAAVKTAKATNPGLAQA